MSTPTGRTLVALRQSNHVAQVVEQVIPYTQFKRDLFSCIDIIAIRRGEPGIIGIQATTRENIAHRIAKARSSPDLAEWLKAGGTFWVWGWYQGLDRRWRFKRVELVAGQTCPEIVPPPKRHRRRHQKGLFDS